MKTVMLIAWWGWGLAAAAFSVWPDYCDITMPPNCAPLNFRVQGAARVRAELRAADGQGLKAEADAEGVISWEEARWRRLLAAHAGQPLELVIWGGDEMRVATNQVAKVPIDAYLSYRLVLPGYVGTLPHGFYARDLTSFKEYTLYRNVQCSEMQCANCHVYNGADPEQYLFHTRWVNPGTQIVSRKWGKRKVNLRTPELFGVGSYAQWHPSGDFIAFSVNETIQSFHLTNRARIEVMDLRSDLIIYSLADDTIIPVELTLENFETYPAWSPNGRQLYSVRARIPAACLGTNNVNRVRLLRGFDTNFRYDLLVRDFDPHTRKVSPPRLLIDSHVAGISITQPRVSPDGRWLVFVSGPHGCFQLNNEKVKFCVMDLSRGTHFREASELTSSSPMSYHTFSHDGAWMVFSARCEDRTYTRPYFTAFDATTGTFSKPFLLPVRNPREHTERMMSYNLPEFITARPAETPTELRRLVESRSRPVRSRSAQ